MQVKCLLFATLLMLSTVADIHAQKLNLDSLKQLLPVVSDSARYELYIKLSEETPNDSALYFADQAQQVAIKLGSKSGVARSLRAFGDYHYAQASFEGALEYYDKARLLYESDNNLSGMAEISKRMAFIQRTQGRYAEALEYAFQALKNYEKLEETRSVGDMLRFIGFVYNDQENEKSAMEYFRKALKVAEELDDELSKAITLRSLSELLDKQGNSAQALEYAAKALAIMQELGDAWDVATSNRYLGRIYHNRQDYDIAIDYYKKALAAFEKLGDKQAEVNTRRFLAESYYAQRRYELAIAQAEKAYEIADEIGMQKGIKETARTLADIYDAQGNARRALMFYRKYVEMKDLLLSSEVQSSIANLQTKLAVEEKAQRIKALELERSQQTLLRNSIIASSVLFFAIVLLVFSSYRAKQQQNTRLQHALKQLRETRAQLISAQKIASVGKLATGMAHELQHPLHSVYRLTEFSKQLLALLKTDIQTTEITDERKIHLQATLERLEQHAEETLQHSAHATALIKSVLEYSSLRASETTDANLNALIADTLKASYRMWQDKYSDFEVVLSVELSERLGSLKLSSQEIRYVLFNLFNNSFDAMHEKQKKLAAADYKPELRVVSRVQNKMVEICVRDNGIGIAPELKEKVFLPFFTTKPTSARHTGLGLSAAHEIIKGYRGEITIESKPGEWTEVLIKLPVEHNEETLS